MNQFKIGQEVETTIRAGRSEPGSPDPTTSAGRAGLGIWRHS